jgi:hypothetical protein
MFCITWNVFHMYFERLFLSGTSCSAKKCDVCREQCSLASVQCAMHCIKYITCHALCCGQVEVLM